MARKPIIIRAGSGLGDSLYLQAIVRHLVARGHGVEVCSDWPDVFRPLGERVTVSAFRRLDVTLSAHYTQRKHVKETDQFQDMCLQAGIREPVELRLDWRPVNSALVRDLLGRAGKKPIVAVQLPRAPMARKDGFGASLAPDWNVLQRAIDALGARAFLVQIGAGASVHRFEGIDLDLANRTSVTDLLDLAWAATGFLGYVSFFVPLAESFAKPALFVWSARGLNDKREFVRRITPEKILHRKDTSLFVWDSAAEETIRARVEEFAKLL